MSVVSNKMEMKQKPPILVSAPGYSNLVPTFLLKLVALLHEEEYHSFVSWSEDGNSFIVKDQANFSKQVLPKYFKHNKFASFVRQLNMYGFRKVTSLQQGGLVSQQEAIEFFHHYFKRGEMDLLHLIKRKVAQSSRVEDLSNVLEDVQDMKNVQGDITHQLSDMRRENEDLWREVVSLRQKHSHQQKVVNRLIQFLVSLVQHHGVGTKRPLQLMIEGGGDDAPSFKYARKDQKNTLPPMFLDMSDGPQITEVTSSKPSTASVSDPVYKVDDTANQSKADTSTNQYITTEAPLSAGDSSVFNLDNNDVVIADHDTFLPNAATIDPDTNVNDLIDSLLKPSPEQPAISSPVQSPPQPRVSIQSPIQNQLSLVADTPLSPDIINSNIDLIQNNLNHIQHRLSKNEQVKLDYDIIQELFNNSVDITPSPNLYDVALPEPSGNELVQYTGGNHLLPAPEDDITGEQSLEDLLGSLKE